MPGVSRVGLRGTSPSVGQRPYVFFMPTVPVSEAGERIEAAVSLPNATTAEPSHRLTPAPQEEPPGTRTVSASQGFTGVPQWGLLPKPPKASSTVCVLPVMTAI